MSAMTYAALTDIGGFVMKPREQKILKVGNENSSFIDESVPK